MIGSSYRAMLVFTCGLALAATTSAKEPAWPGFRGTGDSQAANRVLPLEWGEERNVAWSCELPGTGQSSPVAWNGKAFVTSIKGDEKEALIVACLDIASGRSLWQKEFPASQKGKATDTVSKGAPTPVIDEQNVYALFESGDLVALTHAGEHLWTRSLSTDFGKIEGNHGLGSSPAQTKNTVIVLLDHSGPSSLAAFDKRTGATIWKKDRQPRVSWSSPIVGAGPNGEEIFVSSNGVAQCISAESGEIVWEVSGLKGNTVASPTVTAEAVLIPSGEVGNNLLIRRGGAGNVADTHVLWRAGTVSSSFGSPLIHDGRAYFVNKTSVAFAIRLSDGALLWSQRLPDSTWASPVAAGERVYFFCKDGTTIVARAGDTFEKLAENKLETEGPVYGIAAFDGGFLIRSGNRLVCVREVPAAGK